MGILKKGLVFLLACCYANSFAQDIDITFPSERAVFQRNNSNATIVYIAGNFRKRMDRIEAKLTPIQGGQAIDWTSIVNQPFFGSYRGSLVVQGGWYELKVRGLLDGIVVAENTVSKFGVGEVFLISGQSNAQGYYGRGQKGAYDDRVNVVSNFFSEGYNQPIFPSFGHLDAGSSIAPTGKGAWYWGELGDLLTSRLNVPVLFMNAAWEGFQVSEFIKSSQGGKGTNPYSYNQAPAGYPFGSITDALHYYTNLTGLRAILWHQGESDNYLNTGFQSYYNDLNQVIAETNAKTGKNISWMVARVSKDKDRFYQPVIDAQNSVIGNNSNVFPGPNTDDILDRVDGVHFSTTGFTKVASQWNNYMSSEFFAYSNPTYGNPPVQLESYCGNEDASKPMSLRAPFGYSSYKWNNGSQEREVQVGPGYHQTEAKDIYGNIYYSAPIHFDNSLYPTKPNIQALGETQFCQGQSVELKTNSDYWNYWNTGQDAKSIYASQEGNYYLTHVNIYLCGAESDRIQIKNYPTPVPQIIASGPLDICSDEELILRSNLDNGIEWSTGSTESELKVNSSGTFTLKAKNDFGCLGQSNPVNVTIKPAAQRPVIENLGSDVLCDKDSTILRVGNEQNMKWSSGSSLRELVVKNTGEYFALNTNEFGCTSKSNAINVLVNPIPDKPTILSEGSLEVCNDESVILKASPAYGYNWSTGHTTDQIELTNTKEIYLRTSNEFGCMSEPSDIKEIVVLDKPQNPTILQTGTFTLSSLFTSDTVGIIYQWSVNDTQIESTKAYIKAKKTGDYTLKGLKSYQLKNGSQKVCVSDDSDIFQYYLDGSKNGFSYYPNPAPDKKITVETLEDVDRATVTVFDLAGKPRFSEYIDVFNEPKTFSFPNLPQGKYILKVKNNRTNFTGKIMVE
ncbi:sialate O-acetylesterase [Arcticibacterium luteifluviistationis]|uniref:Sialate O-acetylesterase domain-containing protein n=1 Tax=Arcticibacterium luteifluviistationis TaxID=1784714 RepID=A0A2Z4GID5_9BACT|nr:sialate O-acetylesterase [Arcticibacterium luteifluviistationis]AWW00594.1 hypothetical protein DJ013_21360 [Arcticibacterium luteifluviistationis]